jgi:hypothetical protein
VRLLLALGTPLLLIAWVNKDVGTPSIAGLMNDARLVEFSGMAPSRLSSKKLWALNDGGQEAVLWQLDLQGQIQGSLRMRGVQNVDFEDITSFRATGHSYLAVGDIGDNAAVTNFHTIYVMREPQNNTSAAASASEAAPEWQVQYRYPDGAHDAESLLADADAGLFYVVSKRVDPPILYSIPMRARSKQVLTATRIGALEGIPKPISVAPVKPGRENQILYASQPTGAVLNCKHDAFYLLTYAAIYRYARKPNMSWMQSLPGQIPQRILLPPMLQAEAITFDIGCKTLYVGSEKTPSVLWKFKMTNE